MLQSLQWYEKFTDVDEVIPVSAKYGHGVEDVKEWILSKLPFGPPYYPKVSLLAKQILLFSLLDIMTLTAVWLVGYCKRASREILCC